MSELYQLLTSSAECPTTQWRPQVTTPLNFIDNQAQVLILKYFEFVIDFLRCLLGI